MIFALKQFRAYVYGTKNEIVTDLASLRWLHNLKEPEGRLACWVLKLQAYDYSISHWPGSKHQNADGLSQLPAVHALTAKSEDLFTYLLDQTKIHSLPDIQTIILRLQKDTYANEGKLFKNINSTSKLYPSLSEQPQ